MTATLDSQRSARHRALIRPLFAASVAVETCDPQDDPPAPFPSEAACLSPNAVDKRRREFAAGRAAAHRAMAALGLTAEPILIGPKRAPIWPTGLIGSISHCRSAAVAVATKGEDIQALGVDLEENTPLSDDLIPQICRPAERAWLSRQANPGQLAKVIFSAKEAAYKCQYHLSQQFFGFEGMELELTLDNSACATSNHAHVTLCGRFSACFTAERAPFLTGDRIEGRFAIGEGLIATAAQLSRVR